MLYHCYKFAQKPIITALKARTCIVFRFEQKKGDLARKNPFSDINWCKNKKQIVFKYKLQI